MVGDVGPPAPWRPASGPALYRRGGATSRSGALSRRCLATARRLRTRARAVAAARRSLTQTNVEGVLALQDEAQKHIADGTLVMGRESYYAPEVRKYKGDTGRVFIGN